jgi:hypothetical protein
MVQVWEAISDDRVRLDVSELEALFAKVMVMIRWTFIVMMMCCS